jgi:chitodextrinase
MHSPFRRLLAATVTVASTLILASGAHAAGWDDLGQLSPPSLDQANYPQVAFAPNGSAWVIWQGDEIDLQHIAPDGTKGTPITLDSSSFTGGAQIAATSSGGVVAAWSSGDADDIKVVEVGADGTPGTVRDVGTSPGETFALSIDGSDVASIAYEDSSSLSVQRFAGGDLSGPPIPVWSNGADSNKGPWDVQLATNPAGDSVITWENFHYVNDPDLGVVQEFTRHAALLSRSGTLGTDHELASDTKSGESDSAPVMTPGGDAYVLYNATTLGQQGDLKLAKLSSSDDLTDVATLDSSASTFGAELARSGSGVLTALWQHVDASSDYSYASRRIAADGTVSPPVGEAPNELTTDAESTEGSSLSELSGGSALAVLGVYGSGSYSVRASVIDPSTGPGPAATVASIDSSNSFSGITSAADSTGNAIAIWGTGPTFGPTATYGSYFDGVGPSIDAFGVPSSGTAGDQMVFGTASSDRSGIKGTAWDFGDGGHAGGAVVTHAFGAPGTYTVTATVTDNTDNTTTKSQQVVVRSATAGSGTMGSLPGELKARLAGLHATFHLGRNRTITLQLPAQPVDAFGSLMVRANAGHAARLVTLGSRKFPVFHGKRTKLRIKLSAKTLKLAKHHHGKLKVSVRLVLTGFNGKSAGHTYHLTIRTGR